MTHMLSDEEEAYQARCPLISYIAVLSLSNQKFVFGVLINKIKSENILNWKEK